MTFPALTMSETESTHAGKKKTAIQHSISTRFHLEGIALAAALTSALLGIGITDYSPLQSYRYWIVMMLILALTGMAIGWSRARRLGLPVLKAVRGQLIHWIATWVAVGGILLLLKAGRLNYEGTGLVLLVMLGLATFLDGYRINWHFGLVGLLIFVSGIVAAFIEEYLWVLLVISTGIALLVFFWERHARANRRHNSTQ